MDIQAEEKNSVQSAVSMISLEGSSSRGGASMKTTTGCELSQSVVGKRKRHSRKTRMAQGMAVNQSKAPGRGQK